MRFSRENLSKSLLFWRGILCFLGLYKNINATATISGGLFFPYHTKIKHGTKHIVSLSTESSV